MSTVDKREILHFSKDSGKWWDENGPFKPLHRLNPVRMSYMRKQICTHFALETDHLKPLTGKSLLDIGCGGGLVCEPFARMGAKVTGMDADEIAIDIARMHAAAHNLQIAYICGDAVDHKETYDIVTALEVIEHVSNPDIFIETCARCLKPGGLLILSTLNRTPKSYALGILAAEYVLRWVPKGTHDWKKFLKPSEITSMARAQKLKAIDICGLIYNPLMREFLLSRTDMDVNYMICLKKPASGH